LDNSFAWLGIPAALTMLSVAVLVEILAYYIPVVDNLLDSLATPAAFIAGTVVSAAVMTDVPPMLKWTAAVIAGGGIAGLTALRAAVAHSTVLTGGLGNQLGGALLLSFLALMAPAAAIAVVVLFLWLAIRLLRQVFSGVQRIDQNRLTSMITPPPCKEPKRDMRQIPRGKASANESKYPYIVELAVMGEALDLG
jgi:hypothetical protein